MNLGALIDLGVAPNAIEEELKKLGLDGWHLKVEKDSRGGIFGTKASVVLDEKDADINGHLHTDNCSMLQAGDTHHHHLHGHDHNNHSHEHSHHEHRAYADIKKIILHSTLKDGVKNTALKIFDILAQAEAQVHGKKLDDVCFHEVGAVDSIIDIVGAAVCLDLLGVEKVFSSAVELGGGRVKCAHGLMPVPAPATAILSKNFKTTEGAAEHECTTPTGAAIIAALADKGKFGDEEIKTLACGVGIGQRHCDNLPNVLRVRLCETLQDHHTNQEDGRIRQQMFEICANIDDSTPEELAYAVDMLIENGALDAWQESIVMKKSRLASKICVLCRMEDAGRMEDILFRETSTIGVRRRKVMRTSLKRVEETSKTRYGAIRMKVCRDKTEEKFKPEFEDCASAARLNKVPLSETTKEAKYEFEENRKAKGRD